jgi:hypothetical protein
MDAGTARRLSATVVETLDPYLLMAVLGKRVIHPGVRARGMTRTARMLPGGDTTCLDAGANRCAVS